MIELIRILLAAFALYRLASLISSEEGPYLFFIYKDPKETGFFKQLRKKLGAYDYVYTFDKNGNQRVEVKTNLGRGISCSLCVAGYIALPIILMLQFPTIIGNLIIAYFGIWGMQTFLENLTSDEAIQEAIEDVADTMENN